MLDLLERFQYLHNGNRNWFRSFLQPILPWWWTYRKNSFMLLKSLKNMFLERSIWHCLKYGKISFSVYYEISFTKILLKFIEKVIQFLLILFN